MLQIESAILTQSGQAKALVLVPVHTDRFCMSMRSHQSNHRQDTD